MRGSATEINPIAGIRAVPVVKPPRNDPQLSAVFDIENASGPQPDTFSENGKEMSGGQDDEATESDASTEPSAEASASDSGTVNLFA